MERKDVIDRTSLQRGFDHDRHLRRIRALDDGAAPGPAHGVESQGAVVTRARQNDTEEAVAVDIRRR